MTVVIKNEFKLKAVRGVCSSAIVADGGGHLERGGRRSCAESENSEIGEFLGPGYSKPPIPHCRRKASVAFTMRASGWIDLFNTITMNADTQLSDM
jgi:hypothetical protein